MMTLTQPLGLMTEQGAERRVEDREPINCDLWMVDHSGETVLRCRVLEHSASGMRLRVPLGYGVAAGQRYELRSHLPGRDPAGSLGFVCCRAATVVRTRMHLDDDSAHLEVGVRLDERRAN